jgi:hypothetical protein
VAAGGSWRLLAAAGGSWRLLTAAGGSWRLLAAPGGSWQLLNKDLLKNVDFGMIYLRIII